MAFARLLWETPPSRTYRMEVERQARSQSSQSVHRHPSAFLAFPTFPPLSPTERGAFSNQRKQRSVDLLYFPWLLAPRWQGLWTANRDILNIQTPGGQQCPCQAGRMEKSRDSPFTQHLHISVSTVPMCCASLENSGTTQLEYSSFHGRHRLLYDHKAKSYIFRSIVLWRSVHELDGPVPWPSDHIINIHVMPCHGYSVTIFSAGESQHAQDWWYPEIKYTMLTVLRMNGWCTS